MLLLVVDVGQQDRLRQVPLVVQAVLCLSVVCSWGEMLLGDVQIDKVVGNRVECVTPLSNEAIRDCLYTILRS